MLDFEGSFAGDSRKEPGVEKLRERSSNDISIAQKRHEEGGNFVESTGAAKVNDEGFYHGPNVHKD